MLRGYRKKALVPEVRHRLDCGSSEIKRILPHREPFLLVDRLIGVDLEDESILLPYVHRHAAPQRCYMVRFKVSASRDGIELFPIGNR